MFCFHTSEGTFPVFAMAESAQNNGNSRALRPTTERHGTEPPNVTIDQMLDNLNAYLDKRLGLRKCHDDICQKYSIKYSESGLWALPDIKRAYGKMQRLRTNTNRDGCNFAQTNSTASTEMCN